MKTLTGKTLLIASISVILSATIPAARSAEMTIKPADKLPSTAAGQSWKLAWNDEFDGNILDSAKWDVPEYKRRDALWSRKAVVLDGKGNLALKVLKEGTDYLDGCVRTKGKYEKAFGYFVARMRLQKSSGHWPAFWMYNDSVGKVGNEGRDGTEIDIMEKPLLDSKVQQTLHWDGYGKEHKSEGFVANVPGVMEGWHDFGLLWTPQEYVFYVDGKETWRTKAGGVCQMPLYIKLSDEIAFKGWAGDLQDAKLPDETLVDYVRVYDLFTTDGKAVFNPEPVSTKL
jgi:beta-glucanase (GH16 family)